MASFLEMFSPVCGRICHQNGPSIRHIRVNFVECRVAYVFVSLQVACARRCTVEETRQDYAAEV